MICASPPSRSDSGDPLSNYSEDDGDPPSFADLFGRSCSTTRHSAEIDQTETLFSPSVTATLLSATSAIASNARRRADMLSTPVRRSGRVISRDSGFADSEDSRGSGNDGSTSRLDEFWKRRRKYWETTDIRDEVHELLGFYPSASPPRTVASVGNVSRCKTTSSPTTEMKVKPKRSIGKLPIETEPDGACLSRDISKVTVSKRSGRKIRPPEHMDI